MSEATLEVKSSLWLPPKPKEIDRFPAVDPKVKPCGHRVLVQIRRAGNKIEGSSLDATDDQKSVNQYKCRVGKLVAVGETAYLDRKTGEPWHGGPWAKIGDYVRIPAQGGDRWSVVVDKDYANPVGFAIINDDNILGVTTNPLGDEGDAV